MQSSCVVLAEENEFYNNHGSERKKTNYLLMQDNRNAFSICYDPSNLNRIRILYFGREGVIGRNSSAAADNALLWLIIHL